MRIAVITPVYRTPKEWLEQCLRSVTQQTYPCVHFVVSDGDPAVELSSNSGLQFIRLPSPHEDCGNAARAIGSISAMVRGFDALAYLDADNWFEPDHVEQLLQLHQRTGAAVCTCARNLVDLDGNLLGRCPEVDGERFVDTSCLFLTHAAFGMVSVWYRMPRTVAAACDRVMWQAIKDEKLTRAHLAFPTLQFRTSYGVHYRYFGKDVPTGAKYVLLERSPEGRLAAARAVLGETITTADTAEQ